MTNINKNAVPANQSQYSRLDRAMHNMVFRSDMLQELLADLESTFFADNWKNIQVKKPIFVTSLPRAGTTIVLEVLNQFQCVATHTYRDMPLIFTPVLWNRLSGKIRKKAVLRERAHGDGMNISEDSPEAFEEALWLKYFPEQYLNQHIKMWSNTNNKFTDYLNEHIKKIISLRCPANHQARYVSKNNANISRIDSLKSMFPDSYILIPLRNPITHALSLYRQHTNFQSQHVGDNFVRKYMSDIGHFEFGALHRPIQFPYTNELTSKLAKDSCDYWLAYWISAYEYLDSKNDVLFISFELMCNSPVESLKQLCEKVALDTTTDEIASAAQLIHRPSSESSVNDTVFNRQLLGKANKLYQQLLLKVFNR